MHISMIAAMAHDRVIGKDNQMPWHLPADLAHFKQITLGKPVLMGRNTFESIGRPLPGRRNVVMSRNRAYQADGVEVVDSIAAVLALFSVDGHEATPELMVIGGGYLYTQWLPMATRLYLTHIDLNIAGDTQFPAYDAIDWQVISSAAFPADARNSHPYRFETLQRSGHR